MEKNKKDLSMRLDKIKKTSGGAASKLRTMSVLSKIGIFYRFRRIRWGLLLICLAVYLVISGILEADKLREHPILHCRVDMTCSVPDILAVYIFEILFLLVSFFLMLTGVKRLINAIWVIEHGMVTSAVAGNASEIVKMRKVIKGFYKFYSAWEFACSFTDASGKKSRLNVTVKEKDYLKKGESIDIVYDPGMPSNALAIDALPRFVKTIPEMRER